jgi:hypothetical protein
MPVKYIDVTPISDLFVPATRAYGDIAIVGKGAANSAASAPIEFTNPADAAIAYPPPPATPTATTDLAGAIAIAFNQTPPPTRIWGVQVADQNTDWDAGLAAVAKLAVQIVVLANMPLNSTNAGTVGKLGDHVTTVSNTGGDGKERIGVAMLDSTLAATAQAALNTGSVKSERMFLVAHKALTDDVAAAAAGVIAGYEPHISMLLKPIKLKTMSTTFSDSEIDTFDNASINWITSPALIPGQALFLGEGYTADPSQNKKYIDIVRTIDDINFRIKAELIQAIGNLRVSRSGLRGIVTLVQSVLAPLVAQSVIEDFSIFIPLLVLLDKDPLTLSTAELQQIQQHQADRSVDMVVTVDYAGAIHRLHIKLVFK